ncbi:MAG: HIT domain-containing protein [Lentisphaeria bacterium]
MNPAKLIPEKCAFCKIIYGEIPVEKVYEDDLVLSFLYLSPVNKGHLVVIPKQHYNGPTHMPSEEWGELMQKAAELAAATMRATKSDAYNLLVANGASAGQVGPHLCVHAIPRLADDGVALPARSVEFDDAAEKRNVISKIAEKMAKADS